MQQHICKTLNAANEFFVRTFFRDIRLMDLAVVYYKTYSRFSAQCLSGLTVEVVVREDDEVRRRGFELFDQIIRRPFSPRPPHAQRRPVALVHVGGRRRRRRRRRRRLGCRHKQRHEHCYDTTLSVALLQQDFYIMRPVYHLPIYSFQILVISKVKLIGLGPFQAGDFGK